METGQTREAVVVRLASHVQESALTEGVLVCKNVLVTLVAALPREVGYFVARR